MDKNSHIPKKNCNLNDSDKNISSETKYGVH